MATEVVAPAPRVTQQAKADTEPRAEPVEFRSIYWVGVPLLALVAYLTVLRVGFLSDDFVLLYEAKVHGVSALPVPYNTIIYRPVGTWLTWVLGWTLWGYNPLPFHIISVLLHGASSLVLGLWLSRASGTVWLGWLAGALFAVFPLHIEAVGWAAAQWDEWALLFGLASLYCFTVWWQERSRRAVYAVAVGCYLLAVFTKESMLTWLAVLPLAAWYACPPTGRRQWGVLALALLPFCGVLALNVGLRYATWGTIGSYGGASYNYPSFFWDALVNHGRVLLAPVNASVLGEGTRQVVGAITSVLLLVGVALYGRREWRALLVAGGWMLATLLPAINLPIDNSTLANNRFLYTAAAGYCVGVAALLYTAVQSLAPRRYLAPGLVALVLLLAIGCAWLQLRPLNTATVMVSEVETELRSLVPAVSHPAGEVWYVENAPSVYKGVPVLLLGMDRLRYFNEGETLQLKFVPSAAELDLAAKAGGRDAFSLRFRFDEGEMRYHVDYMAGVTGEVESEPPPEGGA